MKHKVVTTFFTYSQNNGFQTSHILTFDLCENQNAKQKHTH
jgi:hypothetical protein